MYWKVRFTQSHSVTKPLWTFNLIYVNDVVTSLTYARLNVHSGLLMVSLWEVRISGIENGIGEFRTWWEVWIGIIENGIGEFRSMEKSIPITIPVSCKYTLPYMILC